MNFTMEMVLPKTPNRLQIRFSHKDTFGNLPKYNIHKMTENKLGKKSEESDDILSKYKYRDIEGRHPNPKDSFRNRLVNVSKEESY